jgi:predicted nucleic acid-binding protein
MREIVLDTNVLLAAPPLLESHTFRLSNAAILTYNRRDFVEAAKRHVDVLTPAEFLDSLRQTE